MADSPALLISPSPVGAEGRFQRHKRKERPGEQSRYGALPRTPCGARRKRMLFRLTSLCRGTRQWGRFAWSFGQTGVRGLPALTGRAPRRALVTFPQWKVTRGLGLRPQARFEANRRRRLLGRDGAAPQSYLQARFDVGPPQAALRPRWSSAQKLPADAHRPPPRGPDPTSAPALPFPSKEVIPWQKVKIKRPSCCIWPISSTGKPTRSTP